jgi:lysophospholipase L1-like esterase
LIVSISISVANPTADHSIMDHVPNPPQSALREAVTDSSIRRRTVGRKLLVMLLALLFGAGLCECMLRFCGVSFPQLYAPDFHCASRLRANTSGWWITEGKAFVRINSDGMRDREHALQKPANRVRVAVLGDSYTEALQVDVQQAFWSVAERELRRRFGDAGKEVEFLNFGVAGYGTAQELLMLRHHVWKYDPDVIVLVFCHNDIQDNSRELGGGPVRPYFVLRSGGLHLDNEFRNSQEFIAAQSSYEQTKAWIVNQCYTLQLLKHAKMLWHQRRERNLAAARGVHDIGSDFDVYRAPDTLVGETAWSVTERVITEIHSDVIARGRKFGLVSVTTPLQVHPDAELRERYVAEVPGRDLFYTEKRLSRLAEQQDFPLQTLAQPLQQIADSEQVFLHGFSNTQLGTGHWNVAGHRLAGEILADWLLEQLLSR